MSTEALTEKTSEETSMINLDDRFIRHPSLAIEQGRIVINEMARQSGQAVLEASTLLSRYSEEGFRRVVELETGNFAHRLVRISGAFLELCNNLSLRAGKRTFKTADNHHRDDDILVLVALVRAAKRVRNGPNEINFGRNIHRGIVKSSVDDLVLGHVENPLLIRGKDSQK